MFMTILFVIPRKISALIRWAMSSLAFTRFSPKLVNDTYLFCVVLLDLTTAIYLHAFKLQEGLMQTHDEETRKFFKHSSVICTLSPRYASSKLSIFKQQACFCYG